MIGGLGMWELLVILVIVIVIFGASRLRSSERVLEKASGTSRTPSRAAKTKTLTKTPSELVLETASAKNLSFLLQSVLIPTH